MKAKAADYGNLYKLATSKVGGAGRGRTTAAPDFAINGRTRAKRV